MPYIHIRVTDEGVSAEHKRQLIEGTTRLLEQVLGKPPASTFVVIEEVPTDNWGVGGETVTAVRRQAHR
ncbi:putative tautomerase [compost metagenome]|jgi:4-oxalocrotonate tautomerase|uniref:2-hydroxymuconate tautomerase n=1 Tax=Pseudomonas putida (strain W619) TaxID=390235 RepID=B1J7Y9_PSEPW|nr:MULTISPECIES: 4-oxalocrotonate tautomerase family protein [Pseudomonas]MDH1575571.1 4-oxalocrotonate tautomerase family protein [Pseudomonas sp. GD03746]QQE86355.1 4-oxalocrotonate tautomerase family protein [Pseudomonas putida]UTL83376.1 4-oxalocrotonate tautomerase family protein [Pseudomonas putida]HEN8710676.1 4-oxalocrotonate tautomerase family protein [Pseudomonas putida]HEN8715049.1 4-oxalocrotonate tautomerase family protein [Pseudomonas putida]